LFIAFKIAQRLQVKIFQSKIAEFFVWGLTLFFIVMGFLHDILPNDLVPKVQFWSA